MLRSMERFQVHFGFPILLLLLRHVQLKLLLRLLQGILEGEGGGGRGGRLGNALKSLTSCDEGQCPFTFSEKGWGSRGGGGEVEENITLMTWGRRGGRG